MEGNNSTTNAILVILVVVLVGFGVWYMTMRYNRAPAPQETQDSGLQINVGGDTNNPPAPAPTPSTY